MSVFVPPVMLGFPLALHDTPPGLLPAARVTRSAAGFTLDRDVTAEQGGGAYRELLDVVDAWAPPSYRHGTITGRVIVDPCSAGEWHVDEGTTGPRGALRFAVTIAAGLDWPCGHEFRHPLFGTPGALTSGLVAMFRSDEHRRPEVPVAVRRVFLSVALYREHVEADLSCIGLAPLRAEAVPS